MGDREVVNVQYRPANRIQSLVDEDNESVVRASPPKANDG